MARTTLADRSGLPLAVCVIWAIWAASASPHESRFIVRYERYALNYLVIVHRGCLLILLKQGE
jgi:hypothetical protein